MQAIKQKKVFSFSQKFGIFLMFATLIINGLAMPTWYAMSYVHEYFGKRYNNYYDNLRYITYGIGLSSFILLTIMGDILHFGRLIMNAGGTFGIVAMVFNFSLLGDFSFTEIFTKFSFFFEYGICGFFFMYFIVDLISRKLIKQKTIEEKLLSNDKMERNINDFDDLMGFYLDKNFEDLPLGIDVYSGNAVGINHKLLKQHTCLVGTTGSGKTVTLYNFLFNAMLHKKPIIFIDAKGDNSNIQKFLKMVNSEFLDVKKIPHVVTIDGNYEGYNPFKSGTVTELTDKIMTMFDWSEQYYTSISRRFIQLVIKLMKYDNVPINLQNLVRYCNLQFLDTNQNSEQKLQSNNLFGESAQVENNQNDDKEREQLISAIRDFDKKAVESIVVKLATLIEGDAEKLFTENGISVSECIENGESILFSLDSLRYSDFARQIGRLIVNDIKTSVSVHGKNGSKPVAVIIDEFNVLASHEIVDIINKSRSAGFEALLSFQSLSDIDKLEKGENLRRQIIQNCSTLIIQKQNDSHDSEELAKIMGTKEVLETTYQGDTSGVETGMTSNKKVREFLVHPDEIKKLQIGQAFMKSGSDFCKMKVFNNESLIDTAYDRAYKLHSEGFTVEYEDFFRTVVLEKMNKKYKDTKIFDVLARPKGYDSKGDFADIKEIALSIFEEHNIKVNAEYEGGSYIEWQTDIGTIAVEDSFKPSK